jgi:hypothetical protein
MTPNIQGSSRQLLLEPHNTVQHRNKIVKYKGESLNE